MNWKPTCWLQYYSIQAIVFVLLLLFEQLCIHYPNFLATVCFWQHNIEVSAAPFQGWLFITQFELVIASLMERPSLEPHPPTRYGNDPYRPQLISRHSSCLPMTHLLKKKTSKLFSRRCRSASPPIKKKTITAIMSTDSDSSGSQFSSVEGKLSIITCCVLLLVYVYMSALCWEQTQTYYFREI